jgi:hypothetical protein
VERLSRDDPASPRSLVERVGEGGGLLGAAQAEGVLASAPRIATLATPIATGHADASGCSA